MNNPGLFKKGKASKKILVGGPSYEDQISALAQDRYWFVLNTHLLQFCGQEELFCDRVNAFKHALQTYGPQASEFLPSFIPNEGKAKNHVFHGHISNVNGTTFVLEWAVIDEKKRIMAIVGFDSHENYSFRTKPLKKDECTKILANPDNIKIIEKAEQVINETKLKVERTELNYRHMAPN